MILRMLAILTGVRNCPGCGSKLERREAGFDACTSCGAVVHYEAGSWGYAGEPATRPLPGIMGIALHRDAA